MKAELINYLLGSMTLVFLCAFYIFALLGVLFSMLIHYKRKNKKRKIAFHFKYWITDNVIRLFTSIISVYIVARFYTELPIDYELNMFLGFIVGASLDQIIIYIRNKTSINLFQS